MNKINKMYNPIESAKVFGSKSSLHLTFCLLIRYIYIYLYVYIYIFRPKSLLYATNNKFIYYKLLLLLLLRKFP